MIDAPEIVISPPLTSSDAQPFAQAHVVWLDDLPLSHAVVGYGALGMRGSLGYENKQVIVGGRHYPHALSTHPAASLIFRPGGRFSYFTCMVALNDDVPQGRSWADFSVLADGQLVAFASRVVAGAPPQPLRADIRGAQRLELRVRTDCWEFCHAVWLDPQLIEAGAESGADKLIDCLGRAEITMPAIAPQAERCIATIVSPGFSELLDDMLGSLNANGLCQDAILVVFAVNPDEECLRVINKYGAHMIGCRPLAEVNKNLKVVLYSSARFFNAKYFLCLDADMLVLGDLRPVFNALEATAENSILVCRENWRRQFQNLEQALIELYYGQASDFERLLPDLSGENNFPLVVNDGLFAGSRSALLEIDAFIRGWSEARVWMDERPDISWRNQFVFNLALARLRCGVELDPTYNVQLNTQEVEMIWSDGRLQATWRGRKARALHFNGNGRGKYQEWRSQFARVTDPLIGAGCGDGYAAFLTALRGWVGRYGVRALAWSFYGLTDGSDARVRDPGTMPLLALLHYLVRANGCVRVLESGTAKGVSTACLASAVSHRAGGRVVTFDPAPHAERLELWAALPASVSSCVEQRLTGSLEGMTAALECGERYEAALLDSLHTAEHVWSEFQLASQLVCPGGLILIHDHRYTLGTVDRALERIQASGYGVVRLWAAESGVNEDDQLGLAVVENRCRFG
jgi:predicted O-methyltransferase YrrM